MVSKRSLSCPSGDTVIKNLNQKLLKATYNISNHYKHALRTKFCHFRHFSLEILFCCRLILIGTWCNFVYITNTTNNYIHDCHWFHLFYLIRPLLGTVWACTDWVWLTACWRGTIYTFITYCYTESGDLYNSRHSSAHLQPEQRSNQP